MSAPTVLCRVCHGAHARTPIYGCTACDVVLCGEQVNPAALFHFVHPRTGGRAACGRLERLDLTNDLHRDRPQDAVRRGA